MSIAIPGVVAQRLQPHNDERGWFVEIVRFRSVPQSFLQSNHSHSKEGVLRGLHYHRRQADLWYVAAGKAQVGLADLRSHSRKPETAVLILDSRDPTTLYIPRGVAHGFLALTDVDLIYWVTAEYDASDEHGVAWDDPTIAIPWQTRRPILSQRDAQNPELKWESIPAFL